MNDLDQKEMSDTSVKGNPSFPRTSDMLGELIERCEGNEITVGDLTASLKNRVLGFVMMLFALPCVAPVPPGIPFLCGLILLTCGAHLMIGREALWLPETVAKRTIGRSTLEQIVSKTVPVARRLEKVCRPRRVWLTSRLGRFFLGCLVVALSVVLILPIPFLGNVPPGIAIAILALGFIERDGLVIVIGVLVSLAAIIISSAMAWAAIRALTWFMQW